MERSPFGSKRRYAGSGLKISSDTPSAWHRHSGALRERQRGRRAKGISRIWLFLVQLAACYSGRWSSGRRAPRSLFLPCTLNLFLSIFSPALAARVISYPFSSILALLFRLILYLFSLPRSLSPSRFSIHYIAFGFLPLFLLPSPPEKSNAKQNAYLLSDFIIRGIYLYTFRGKRFYLLFFFVICDLL